MRLISLISALIVLAASPALAKWEIDYSQSMATGAKTCFAFRDGEPLLYMGYLSRDGILIERVALFGEKHPGTLMSLRVDEKYFSAPEDNSKYWGQKEIVAALKEGDYYWAEWTDWPNKLRSYEGSLGGFTWAYNECKRKLGV